MAGFEPGKRVLQLRPNEFVSGIHGSSRNDAGGEFDLHPWLRARTPADPRVLVGPGDDCAVLAPPRAPLLVTTDMLMDGTDFVLAEVGPRRVGRKAMAREPERHRRDGRGADRRGRERRAAAVSRLRGAAGDPLTPPLSPSGREDSPKNSTSASATWPTRSACRSSAGTRTVGPARWSSRSPPSARRPTAGRCGGSGAKPGDWVFVTGPLGGSILGRHLDFTPRVREALALHAAVDLHAMIDVSDGLAADLNHILEESRCGAVLDAEAIPVAAAAVELSRTSGKTPLQHALGDGEDFELVFTVSPADGERLLRDQPVPGLAKIGECVERGLWIEEDGTRRPLEPTGWVHEIS